MSSYGADRQRTLAPAPAMRNLAKGYCQGLVVTRRPLPRDASRGPPLLRVAFLTALIDLTEMAQLSQNPNPSQADRQARARPRIHARRIDSTHNGGVLPLKAAIIAQRFAQGETPTQIASALGLSKSTVSDHLKRADANVGRGYIGRKIVCEIGRSGVRVGELCDIRIGHVRPARPRRREASYPRREDRNGHP
jgi:DNA-binding CsgD family transcriptional regulator